MPIGPNPCGSGESPAARQERRDPAAIGLDPVLFGLLKPRAGFGEALGPIDAEVGDDALIGLVSE